MLGAPSPGILCPFRSMKGLSCLAGACEGHPWHPVGNAGAEAVSSALILLSLESTRLFFHLPNIWDQAAASHPSCAYPGHWAGVGKERQLQCSSSACCLSVCLSAFLHIPALCCHKVKDVPGDGGSQWEVLDQGLVLLGMRFGTNTVFSQQWLCLPWDVGF